MLESVQPCWFELSMHFSGFFPRRTSCDLLKIVRGLVRWNYLDTNVWRVQNATGCFLAQPHSSMFFCKILCLVSKVSHWRILQKRSFVKIIWHRIPIQTLLFQDVYAHPSKWLQNRDVKGLLIFAVEGNRLCAKIETHKIFHATRYPRYPRVFFVALHDIPETVELLWDYNDREWSLYSNSQTLPE